METKTRKDSRGMVSILPWRKLKSAVAFLETQPKWVKEGGHSSRESFCLFLLFLSNFSHSGTFCDI